MNNASLDSWCWSEWVSVCGWLSIAVHGDAATGRSYGATGVMATEKINKFTVTLQQAEWKPIGRISNSLVFVPRAGWVLISYQGAVHFGYNLVPEFRLWILARRNRVWIVGSELRMEMLQKVWHLIRLSQPRAVVCVTLVRCGKSRTRRQRYCSGAPV